MKYLVQITVEDYWRFVVEDTSAENAEESARIGFDSAYRADLRPTITVEPVPDDTPVGDA